MKYFVTGQIPSGLYLLTYFDNLQTYDIKGVLVSWVQQASFDPVIITTALEKGRPALSKLSAGSYATLHALSEKDKQLFKDAVKDMPETLKKLTAKKHIRYDVPVFEEMNSMVLHVLEYFETGTHMLMSAKVLTEVEVNRAKPWIHLRGSALHY